MAIQVILTQNVAHLGSLGDQIHVKDGYARNYLLPRGLALISTTKNAREIQHHQRKLEQMRAEAIALATLESGKVADLALSIKVKAGPGGRLFGSVTNRDVQALLAGQGYEVDRKAITLHEPIKSLGTFGATVKLHTEVKVDVAINVKADGEIPAAETPVEENTAGEGQAAEADSEKPEEGVEPGKSAESPANEAPSEESASTEAPENV